MVSTHVHCPPEVLAHSWKWAKKKKNSTCNKLYMELKQGHGVVLFEPDLKTKTKTHISAIFLYKTLVAKLLPLYINTFYDACLRKSKSTKRIAHNLKKQIESIASQHAVLRGQMLFHLFTFFKSNFMSKQDLNIEACIHFASWFNNTCIQHICFVWQHIIVRIFSFSTAIYLVLICFPAKHVYE